MLKRISIALAIAVLSLPALGLQPARAGGPDVVAEQWAIMDATTGTLIAGQGVDSQRAMASLTKVMTAIVAIERGHLDMPVTITQGDKVPEASAGFFVGGSASLRTLLHGLLLASGNDAAMAIARAVGGSAIFESDGARAQFVTWMNEKAEELGLSNTHFQNPHGLDEEGHYSTPRDLAVLTQFALSMPEFREIFGTESYSGDGYHFEHGNQLAYMLDNLVGGKTGWTDGCGRCLIEVVNQGGRDVIIVLLGSNGLWYDDALALNDYAAALPAPADNPTLAGAVFDRLWERTDSLVASGAAQRTWLWGQPLDEVGELTSEGSTSGNRFERLYEKGRMEINNPYSQMDSGWYITPGRLASELIDGGARIPLAGDLSAYGPLYAHLKGRAWEPRETGQPVTLWLSSGGQFVAREAMLDYGVTVGTLSQETGIATASVFEDYLRQTAPVVERGAVVNGLLFNPPLHAVGFPITEPFWVTVPENGGYVDVLVQCFERRCLTYTPSHEPAWQVEMSNIGTHYQLWQTSGPPENVASFAGTRHVPRLGGPS